MPAMGGMHAVAALPAPRAVAAPVRTGAPSGAIRPAMRTSSGVAVSRAHAAPPLVARGGTHPVVWNRPHKPVTIPSGDPVFPNGLNIVDGYPVPGLGFDYVHYFATHPNTGRGHLGFGYGLVIPFWGGGVYVPEPIYSEQSAAAEQPAEQAAADQPDTQQNGDQPGERENGGAVRARFAPLTEQTEYVFVKRDGSLIFAVAFTYINDRLQYVTQEGLRRTVSLDTLDLDATQQFNQQRGVEIHLPA